MNFQSPAGQQLVPVVRIIENIIWELFGWLRSVTPRHSHSAFPKVASVPQRRGGREDVQFDLG